MADGLIRLLTYLTERKIIQTEQKEVQLSASPRAPEETLAADQKIALERERERVHDLGAAFAAGLRRAHQARSDGQASLALDDRRAEDNQQADALVQFLVRPHLATSHTEQTEPDHYTYHITIDWPRLTQIATESGIDLDAELSHS